jgi:hypothetical protein
MNYSYSDLKYMNPQRLEEVLSVFHCIKVPVTAKDKVFLYFRRFPTESLLNKVDPKAAAQSSKSAKMAQFQMDLNKKTNANTKPGQISLKANQVKSYQNPMHIVQKSAQDIMDETTKKILNNFPMHRSLLVVNYDKEHNEEFLKSVFSTFGKVRRVFNHKFVRETESKKKKIFFTIVIFQDQISLLRCFDVEEFQWQLFDKFLPQFKAMSEVQREYLFREYVSSLEDNINFQE